MRRLLALSILAVVPAFAQIQGEVKRGDISFSLHALSIPAGVMGAVPRTPTTMIWVKTEDPETNAFHVVVKYSIGAAIFYATETFARASSPYTMWSFRVPLESVRSVSIEELKPAKSEEFQVQ